MAKREDISEKNYGRLTALSFVGKTEHRKSLWKCLCSCGTEIIVEKGNLSSGNTQSCGCYQRERASEGNIVHGMTGTRMHRIWKGMRTRCTNPKAHQYKDYGGRGIRVCERWESFESFYEDMKAGYTDELSIDRINNDGDYAPNNCRWATRAEQAKNKRTKGDNCANTRT